MQKGKIKSIKIFTNKGEPGQNTASVCCVVDSGLTGDRFAKGGEKQLTMIDDICSDWLSSQIEQGLCFKRFKANITVENIDISLYKSGDKLLCGDAAFEFSQENKECFAECPFVQQKKQCMLRTHAKYLKVIEGGTVSTGDEITEKE